MASNELYLYGSVGADWWGGDFFTATEVRDELSKRTGPLCVRINSGGGIATEGQAIYTMLCDYPDQVTVIVDGVAASAASLIAMAGDEIIMRLGSHMLIHDPACPYTEGRGTEEDHLRLAKQLNVTSGAYADIYALRAGISREEARAVMRDETFLDGPQAVEMGFATTYDGSVAAAVAARFDYRIYAKAPESLRQASEGLGLIPAREAVMAMMAGTVPRSNRGKGVTMAKSATETPVVNSAVDETEIAETIISEGADSVPGDDAETIVASATKAERERAQRIRTATTMAKLPQALADKLIAEGVSVDKALDTITANWKKEGDVDLPMHGREPAKVGMDAREKFITGATLALQAKAMLPGGERNEFSSMSLSEIARHALSVNGFNRAYSDKREMIGAAFTMDGGAMTVSDFSNVLANLMNKAALVGWEESEETYQLWTRKGYLADFKATKRVGVGVFAALPQVIEGANYTYGTVSDRGEAIALATYGKLARISRQAIINDDLNSLGDIPRRMGRAARRTIGNLAYAVLTGNPTMSDSVALFHSSHANLAGTTGAPSVATLGAAKAAMRVQSDNGSALNITPKYLIVPAALEMTAKQVIGSAVDPTTSKGMAMNPVNNMAEVIVDARLDAASTTAWFLAADPNAYDTVEVAYLDGNEAPYLEQQTQWTADGVEMKVRIDAGVSPLDYRTLYKNAG